MSQSAFFNATVKRVDQKAGRFQRENFFKIYLTNPSLRSALFAPLTAEADGMGALMETAIFSQWMQRTSFIPYYARWKNGEVDLININRKKNKPDWAVEIKWSNRFFEAPNELKSLVSFCTENNLSQALTTTIDKTGIKGIILSGGPASVTASDAPQFDSEWLNSGLPTLGVCYGMQLLAHHFGGSLGSGASREYGHSLITVHQADSIFANFTAETQTTVWMSHGDHVERLPEGFVRLASGQGCPVAAMADTDRRLYGIQFHPEVVHTPKGKQIIANLLIHIARPPF